jgi:mannose-6-phosphate isomerase-like protein (cupin superfamily)
MTSAGVRTSIKGQVITLLEALSQLPGVEGRRFAELLRHRSLSVEVYSPRNPPRPEVRDMVYMIVQGSGDFLLGEERLTFGVGDFLFVPAGAAQRFLRYTDDLVVWIIFYD